MKYTARNKNDLIIEVWEKLDCETVGARELLEIEQAVVERFGQAAVDSPMVMARLLADEGADLRHSEIMQLFLERNSGTDHDAALRNLLKLSDLRSALRSIREVENVRRRYESDGDKEGLRKLREMARERKADLLTKKKRPDNAEIAEWITIWLQSPEIFENWIALRMKSEGFATKFGGIEGDR